MLTLTPVAASMPAAARGLRERWNCAADALAAGVPVVLSYRNRSVIVYTAGEITTVQMADLIARSSGFVQVALPEHVCERLVLHEASTFVRDVHRPAHGQCVSVDAAHGVTTGISAHDRARTARVLCDPGTVVTDLTRPGHLVPVAAHIHDLRDVPTDHLATVALSLVGAKSPTPGAVFADLVSPTNPLNDATPLDALRVADELDTVVIRLD